MINGMGGAVAREPQFKEEDMTDESQNGNEAACCGLADIPDPNGCTLTSMRLPATLSFADWGLEPGISRKRQQCDPAPQPAAKRTKLSEKEGFAAALKACGVTVADIEPIYDSLKSTTFVWDNGHEHPKRMARRQSDQALIDKIQADAWIRSLLATALGNNNSLGVSGDKERSKDKTQEARNFATPCLTGGKILPASIADFLKQCGVEVSHQKIYHLRNRLRESGVMPKPIKARKLTTDATPRKRVNCSSKEKNRQGAPAPLSTSPVFHFAPPDPPAVKPGDREPETVRMPVLPTWQDDGSGQGDLKPWSF